MEVVFSKAINLSAALSSSILNFLKTFDVAIPFTSLAFAIN